MQRWQSQVSRWSAMLALVAACSKREAPRARDAEVVVADAPADAPADALLVDATPDAASVPDAKITAVAMDRSTTCVRRSDGALRCWGSSARDSVGSVVPIAIERAPEAVALDVAHGMLAIATRGGDLALGPLALPAQPELALVTGIGEVIAVQIASATRTYALNRGGEVHAVEAGTTTRVAQNVIALSASDALHRDGTVSVLASKVLPVAGLRDADALVGTGCAHRRDGGIACWDRAGKSVAWRGPTTAIDRRSADGTTCTLASGSVACSGRNEAGQLGTGGTSDRSDPRVVPLPARVAAIAVGDRAWCAVLDSGALACWGANERGQLGDSTLIDRERPVIIAGAASATPPTAPTTPAVEQAADAMDWSDLPASCTRPSSVPSPAGEVRVASAYAVLAGGSVQLWFADMNLVQGGYRRDHVVARGDQRAVVYTLAGKRIERGRYRGSKGARTATVALASLEPRTGPADVLVEKLEGEWLCGTLLAPHDATQRTPFAARIGKPRYR